MVVVVVICGDSGCGLDDGMYMVAVLVLVLVTLSSETHPSVVRCPDFVVVRTYLDDRRLQPVTVPWKRGSCRLVGLVDVLYSSSYQCEQRLVVVGLQHAMNLTQATELFDLYNVQADKFQIRWISAPMYAYGTKREMVIKVSRAIHEHMKSRSLSVVEQDYDKKIIPAVTENNRVKKTNP